MSQAEQITPPLAFHGEGPVWHDAWGELRFVDMLAGAVVTLDTVAGTTARHQVGTVVAAIRPRRRGGMVAAVERGFAFVADDWTVTPLPELWQDPAIRMNEGGCDPDGRFYCGTMAYDITPGAARLYRLDADGTTSVVLADVTLSNGLAWSPDHATAYYVDSVTHRIDAFDFTPGGGLSGRRPVVAIEAAAGMPDGLTVDADGRLWVALWGGSAVRCYAPDGRLEETVELPVSQVTACSFGGPALDELFITTSRQEVPDGEQPAAGSIFRVRPGARGLPVLTFSG